MIDQVRNMATLVGAGVVVIDHDLAFITGICDRIYCLDQGAVIAEGTPAEIQANPHVQAGVPRLGGGGLRWCSSPDGVVTDPRDCMQNEK